MRLFSRAAVSIFLSVLSLAVAVSVSEILLRNSTLRGYAPAFALSNLKNATLPNTATTTHFMAGGSYEYWTNEHGCFDLRLEEKTAPYVYLTGDSFTWGYASFDEKWGTKLEGHLGIRVAKCAMPGVGTAQELLKARSDINEIGAPELIVVGYYGNNDLMDDVLFDLYRDPKKVVERWKCAPQETSAYWKVKCWLDTHSVVYTLAEAFLKSVSHDTGFRNAIDTMFFVPLPQTPSISEEHHKLHEASILGFENLAREHGSALLFVLIPSSQEVAGTATTSSNLTAKTFLEQRGIRHIDLHPLLRESYVQTGRSLYWPRDAHFNTEGNHLVAELVADYIRAERILVQETDKPSEL